MQESKCQRLAKIAILARMAIMIIGSIIIFAACSNEDPYRTASELFTEDILDDKADEVGMSANHEPDNINTFHASTIFENVDFNETVVGLHRLEDEYEAEIREQIGGEFLHYTYFDFAGDGTLNQVVFSISLNPIGGSEYAIGADTRVSVKADGVWHHAWFFSRALMLKLVVPYMFIELNENTGYTEVYALLAVGYDVGMRDSAQLITFRDGELQVQALIPVDARPDWYWTWQEDN